MSEKTKQLSNPFSVGGGGVFFENHVQSAFAVLMLTGGFAPCLPLYPIKKIKLQGKYAGYDTDDLIVFTEDPATGYESKILGQIKHTINITENDKTFSDVIRAAWNDFNNPQIFNSEKDAIALITGPLSATDIENVRWILELARHSDDSNDFIQKVEMVKFSSEQKRSKLAAFRSQLNKANCEDISDNQLWNFLKCFHLLGYDLDIRAGVTLSLLHTLIGQYSPDNVQKIWLQVIDEVSSANQNAGTLELDKFPQDVREAFKEKASRIIPGEFLPISTPTFEINAATRQHGSELATAMLIGAWNELSKNDKAIVESVSCSTYDDWIKIIREVFSQSGSPLSLKNGKWKVNNRRELWEILGPRLFDDHLNRFKENAVIVLKECDPKLDLPPYEQLTANIYGKVLSSSHTLRNGFAESLALLGSHPDSLTSCTSGKVEETAVLSVREILMDADWVLWASLNDLLPLLAEASPREFLDAVEKALTRDPCPFDMIFAQESSAVFGTTYMSGLLWALETLAWDAEYFMHTIILLGELAARDPGGNWGNRPGNSLKTIFLPWLPQTCASIAKRKIAIVTLMEEQPQVAWTLLISLLPQSHQASSGSRKPEWREILSSDCEKHVTQNEYLEQIVNYAELAIDLAKSDPQKLVNLIDHFDQLPHQTDEKLMAYLNSDEIASLSEAERFPLWDTLTDLITKHRKYADAVWAMKPDKVDKIVTIANRISPTSPYFYHQRLFRARAFELFEEIGSFEEQLKKLEEARQHAINEIFRIGGIEAVFNFATDISDHRGVGLSFGYIDIPDVDKKILPNLLETERIPLAQFAGGFVIGKFHSAGWQWVDSINVSEWSPSQIGLFFSYLPGSSETWKRVSTLLKDNESPYWSKANVVFFKVDDDDLEFVVDHLLQYGRPNEAISFLYTTWNRTKNLNTELAIKSLLASINSTENISTVDKYEITEIIKALQNDTGINPDEIFKIEWAYLPLLNQYGGTTSPKFLELKLASTPGFFCEVIRAIFRSKKDERSSVDVTEQEKKIALNAYRLLSEWKTPPGYIPDGNYNGDALIKWLDAVKKECAETGHLEVAMAHVGHVLIYTPADPDGLWIHHSAAEALNAKDADVMRDGYRVACFNARGVFSYSEGKEEKGLAEKYREQAEKIESRGYYRFAEELRKLADLYEHEAKLADPSKV